MRRPLALRACTLPTFSHRLLLTTGLPSAHPSLGHDLGRRVLASPASRHPSEAHTYHTTPPGPFDLCKLLNSSRQPLLYITINSALHEHHSLVENVRRCSRLEHLVGAGVVCGSREEARKDCQRDQTRHSHDSELAQPLQGAQQQFRHTTLHAHPCMPQQQCIGLLGGSAIMRHETWRMPEASAHLPGLALPEIVRRRLGKGLTALNHLAAQRKASCLLRLCLFLLHTLLLLLCLHLQCGLHQSAGGAWCSVASTEA